MTFSTPKNGVTYGRESHGNKKSEGDQLEECHDDMESLGVSVRRAFRDGTSASRFAAKVRDEWPQLVASVDAREINGEPLDIICFWECSRGSREPIEWFTLLALCRARGVLIRVTSHERTYDLSRPNDWKDLADEGVDAAHESERTAVRTRRGTAKAAEAGKPHGQVAYGFKRTYDEKTRKVDGQVHHESEAPIVEWIFAQFIDEVPLKQITAELNANEIPSPSGGKWRWNSVARILERPEYAALRRHNGQLHETRRWQPIVPVDAYWTAHRILSDPQRRTNTGKTTRPGAQRWLLSNIAICGICNESLVKRGGTVKRAESYRCNAGHVNISMPALDDYVTDAILDRLSIPENYASLRESGERDDREVVAARAEVKRLKTDLDNWRRSAGRGQTSPESLAVIEADLTVQIKSAEQRATRAGVPHVLRSLIEPGVDLRTRWAELPIAGRRSVIRAVVELRVGKAVAHHRKGLMIEQRLSESFWRGESRTWGDRWLDTPFPGWLEQAA